MHAIKSLIIALAVTASATYFNGEHLRREVLQVRATTGPTTTTTTTVSKNSTSKPTTTVTAAKNSTIGPTITATVSKNSTNSTNACTSVLQGLATLITGLPTPTGALSTYLVTAASTLTNPCSLSVPSSVASAFSVYESSVISFYSAHSSQLNSALSACPSLTNLVANPVCSTTHAVVTANAGPRETGMMAAAVAAAGVLGAAAIIL